MMDVLSHNRAAWDQMVGEESRWTQPVSSEEIARARGGDVAVILTPMRVVPTDWFPPLPGARVLCLAGAGGQQGPILAAAGAEVTVFDNSPRQLAQDRWVAERDQLSLETIEGDMADLSRFADQTFDLIFHPCSNAFVPDVLPVWRECYRVLRRGATLLAGFSNPLRYLFDDERKENGNLQVCYTIPYSDLDYLHEEHIRHEIRAGRPLEFGHRLQDQIGGQLDAGLLIAGFYEDRYPEADADPLSARIDTFIATRALRP